MTLRSGFFVGCRMTVWIFANILMYAILPLDLEL